MTPFGQKFIALDLETTHLDPREGRIMEVGAVALELFFDREEKLLKPVFAESFTTLVNPGASPSPAALALTGITEAELRDAPSWSDVKQKLERFLADKTLIGHNLGFDLEFLLHQKLNIQNPWLDTLEIAQTMLPLLSAHSLEFLREELALPAASSHRALDDSKNAAWLLAAVLNVYLSFPQKLKSELRQYLNRSNLPFRELFLDLPETQIQFAGKNFLSPPPSLRPLPSREHSEFASLAKAWAKPSLVSLPLGFNRQRELLSFLLAYRRPGLAALSHTFHLDQIPEKQRYLNPARAVCLNRLALIKDRSDLPAGVHKLLIKIAIARAQQETLSLSALKLTPEERKFLPLFTTEAAVCTRHKCEYFKRLKTSKNSLFFADLETFFALVQDWNLDFSEQKALLFDLGRIEDEFAKSHSQSWSLGQIRQRLLRIFPLESSYPSYRSSVPAEALQLANELDLFFGILHLIFFKQDAQFAEIVYVNAEARESERFQKLLGPAEKLVKKIRVLKDYLHTVSGTGSAEVELEIELGALGRTLEHFAEFLGELFFSEDEDFFYAIRLGRQAIELQKGPRALQKFWAALTSRIPNHSIIDTRLPSVALSYFKNRLGLRLMEMQPTLSFKPQNLKIALTEESFSVSALQDLLLTLRGKTVILAPNLSKLQELSTLSWPVLPATEPPQILSYKFSGSPAVLKNKFAKSKNAVLILTTNVFLRGFLKPPPANNLVILRLPFEAPHRRPGLEREKSERSFAETVLPRAVHLLHTILDGFFATAAAPAAAYLLDQRALLDYEQAFLNYFREFPDFSLVKISRSKTGMTETEVI